jgi:ABC-2 type transport system permease protein
MINAIRSEWIKLRSVRMNLVLVIIAVLLPMVITILISALAGTDDIDAETLVASITGSSVVSALLIGVIGIVSIGGEFSHGTIRPTFAATPKRWTIIIAKAIVTAVVSLVVQAAVVLLTYVISSAVASGRGATITLADFPEAREALFGIIVYTMILGLLGLALGLLIRNMPSAIAVLILWPLLLEGLIAGLLSVAGVDNPFKWLPFNAGTALGNPDGPSSDELGRLVGGTYFGLVTLAVFALGGWFTSRRDA